MYLLLSQLYSMFLDALKVTLLLELSARAATRCTPILALHNVSLSVAHIAADLQAHNELLPIPWRAIIHKFRATESN